MNFLAELRRRNVIRMAGLPWPPPAAIRYPPLSTTAKETGLPATTDARALP